MKSFEQEYYEDESFWAGGMVQDEANRVRIERTAAMIPASVGSLVDVGCGNGVFVNYLTNAKPQLEITGVDRSVTALTYVNTKKREASIDELPFADKEFDCVTCLEVIEHLPETIYQKSLDELARVSKQVVIISVPNNEKLEDSYTKCPNCLSIFNYELHLRKFDKQKLQQLMSARGFDCKEIITTGTGKAYYGHKAFRKLFYPEQMLKWNSPICPICGYREAGRAIQNEASKPIANSSTPTQGKRKLISYFTAIPKFFWPKESKDYWMIARFERV